MFEKNRFLIAGISAGLPNGRYLTTHPAFENENTLMFADKEQTFYMEVQEVGNTGFLEKSKRRNPLECAYCFIGVFNQFCFKGKRIGAIE